MTNFCRGPWPRSCSLCSLFVYEPEVGAADALDTDQLFSFTSEASASPVFDFLLAL